MKIKNVVFDYDAVYSGTWIPTHINLLNTELNPICQ